MNRKRVSMKSSLKLFLTLLIFVSCDQTGTEPQRYSIETLMSNNRSSGGYFSKDGSKLLYSSDKSGIFNIYEVDFGNNCFVGPFVEIQKGVKVGANTKIQSHSFVCELVEYFNIKASLTPSTTIGFQ